MVPGAEGTRARPTSAFPHYFSKGKRPTFQPIGLEPVPRLIALAPLPRPLPHPQPIGHVLDPLPEGSRCTYVEWSFPATLARLRRGLFRLEQVWAKAGLILLSAPLRADPFEGTVLGTLSCPASSYSGLTLWRGRLGPEYGGRTVALLSLLVDSRGQLSQTVPLPPGKGEPAALENQVCLSICLPACQSSSQRKLRSPSLPPTPRPDIPWSQGSDCAPFPKPLPTLYDIGLGLSAPSLPQLYWPGWLGG